MNNDEMREFVLEHLDSLRDEKHHSVFNEPSIRKLVEASGWTFENYRERKATDVLFATVQERREKVRAETAKMTWSDNANKRLRRTLSVNDLIIGSDNIACDEFGNACELPENRNMFPEYTPKEWFGVGEAVRS